MTLEIRLATLQDARLLLAWRNDPTTREFAFDQGVIRREEHREWLNRKLTDHRCALFILEDAGEPVAQVRLDKLPDGGADVDVAVAPQARGQGLGTQALRRVVPVAADRLEASCVIARVKPGNEASLRTFAAAGFECITKEPGVISLRWTPRSRKS
jgi:RimJ/RimL family protein N-acetyltransferase